MAYNIYIYIYIILYYKVCDFFFEKYFPITEKSVMKNVNFKNQKSKKQKKPILKSRF